jgi:hypothetical protein
LGAGVRTKVGQTIAFCRLSTAVPARQ